MGYPSYSGTFRKIYRINVFIQKKPMGALRKCETGYVSVSWFLRGYTQHRHQHGGQAQKAKKAGNIRNGG
ncbi:hypothetical protein SAMN06265379_103108 [Saccharicrinis carchari]|uniref:Uncharacterized protein n=1 Tax=Saccharicrinis carchari TaxID=1168039 RepID=A0A521CI83_SACCC|nr:hypothetical protein SAMN06265379_103108 [Saccharicrinis carchari]